MTNEPLWASPERKAHLVKLWLESGNRCLLGHQVCPIPEHYAYNKPQAVEVAIPRERSLYPKLWRQINKGMNEPIKLPAGLEGYEVKVIAINRKQIARLYAYLSEMQIESWKKEDRLLRQAELRAWQRELHRLPTRNKPRCEFNADNFFDNQPIYYLDGFGINALTFKPFARVRLSSGYACIFVELDKGIFRGVSKSRKRKAIRYGKPLPETTDKRVNLLVRQAVKHYLKW